MRFSGSSFAKFRFIDQPHVDENHVHWGEGVLILVMSS